MPHRQLELPAVPGLWPLTWPMGLTMLRLLLLPVFLWLLLASGGDEADAWTFRWWAVGVYAVMALTDKLDGYLARRLNQVSRLGTILDPVADKLLVASSVVLLSFGWVATRPYRIPLAVVTVIYGGYVFVAGGTLALLVRIGKVSIFPRPLGKANTVLQLALVMLTLIAPVLPADPARIRPLLVALWWVVPAGSSPPRSTTPSSASANSGRPGPPGRSTRRSNAHPRPIAVALRRPTPVAQGPAHAATGSRAVPQARPVRFPLFQRLCFRRYSLGGMPVRFLKTTLKYSAWSNPTRRATSDRGKSVCRSSSFTRSICTRSISS